MSARIPILLVALTVAMLSCRDDGGGPGGAACTPGDDVDCDGDGWSGAEDCDDDDANAYPGAAEICGTSDHDCDGVVGDDDPDAANPAPWYLDGDGDGYGDDSTAYVESCSAPSGYAAASGDCNDANATVYPGAEEACDGIDQACDGDDTDEEDGDGDGVMACADDCDDGNPNIYPGRAEACDGIDNDCNDIVDDAEDADGDGWNACEEDCDDCDCSAPDLPELPGTGVDEDCDGSVDESG